VFSLAIIINKDIMNGVLISENGKAKRELQQAKSDDCAGLLRKKRAYQVMSSTFSNKVVFAIPNLLGENPSKYAQAMFEANGYLPEAVVSFAKASFLPITAKMLDAYQRDKLQSVRENNIDMLREMHLSSGETLQCCNRFGESLIHMACRRGNLDLVKFMILECQVSIRVKDDFGRTPLHDACWAPTPVFELIHVLISQAPDLLLVPDVRGDTPFDYCRKEHWNDWINFLSSRQELMRLPLQHCSNGTKETCEEPHRNS
jgi:hypothetical protein